MAEGGAVASTEVTDRICDVCLDDDSFRRGTWFCQQCKQRLCDKCRKYHEKVSTTKNHALIPADEMPVTRASLEQQERVSDEVREQHEGVSDEVRSPMCQLHNLPIEFYCQKHNTTLCATCKLMGHRNCSLKDLEHAAAGNTSRGHEVIREMRALETRMEKVKEAMEDEKTGMQTKKSAVVEKIIKKIKEIEALGEKKLAEVEDIVQLECESLDKSVRVLAQSKVLVGKSIQGLERVTQVGTGEEIFVETKKAEEDVSKFSDILRDSSKVSRVEIDVEIDNRLKDLTSIGDLSVCKSTVDLALEVTDSQTTDHVDKKLNLPPLTDVYSTGDLELKLSWFDILPNGRLILLLNDYSGGDGYYTYLTLHDDSEASLHQREDISTTPTVLNDTQIVVAASGTQLQIVDIDGLREGPLIDVDVVWIRRIQKFSDSSVLVLAKEHDGKLCFKVVDRAGKVHKYAKLSTNLNFTKEMRVNRERNTVYIIDSKKGYLGFNLKGDMIFHYAHEDYDRYGGLAVDPRGALYFFAEKNKYSKCLIKLSPAGKVLAKIDAGDMSYQLQCSGDKLYMSRHTGEPLYDWAIKYINI